MLDNGLAGTLKSSCLPQTSWRRPTCSWRPDAGTMMRRRSRTCCTGTTRASWSWTPGGSTRYSRQRGMRRIWVDSATWCVYSGQIDSMISTSDAGGSRNCWRNNAIRSIIIIRLCWCMCAIITHGCWITSGQLNWCSGKAGRSMLMDILLWYRYSMKVPRRPTSIRKASKCSGRRRRTLMPMNWRVACTWNRSWRRL